MTQRIGFFGGTFDPLHFGHLNLAIALKEHHQLDHVLVCPASCSVFKTSAPPIASAQDRLAMLQLALQPLPDVSLCLLEIFKETPTYTIDTIRELHKTYPHLHLLLSEETLLSFADWKEAATLAQLAPLLVGTRMHATPLHAEATFSATLTPTPVMEISSHAIRERLKKKFYCGHLVPEKVLDYIHAHGIYS